LTEFIFIFKNLPNGENLPKKKKRAGWVWVDGWMGTEGREETSGSKPRV
jgi:hypothetical protein